MRHAIILALGTALATTSLAMAAPDTAAPKAAAAKTAPAKAAKGELDPTISPPGWSPPKTAWGAPDFSGYWSNATMTPLTRNSRLTNKGTLSAKEAKGLEGAFAEALAEADRPTDQKKGPGNVTDKDSAEAKLVAIRPDFAAAGGDVGGYNTFWIDPGAHIMEVNGEYRSSIITTENGLPPARKPSAGPAPGFPRDSYDSYEVRGLGDRCIMGFGRNAGPPMLANGYYNNSYYFIQTPDTVVIQIELIHDTRIVRIGGKHRTDGVRTYMGDSIGHYEGNTLVVETTNMLPSQNFMGSWKNLTVTERFTRVSPTRINYKFDVYDPDTWVKPLGGEYEFYPLHGIVYEYACHEGNYALPAILAGARRKEAEESGKANAPKPGAE
jgi:hypothetical protein